LVITNGNENNTIVIQPKSTWGTNFLIGWINIDQLILYTNNALINHTRLLYTPFTCQSQLFTPTLPNLLPIGFHFGWFGAEDDPLYDPNLIRAVYFSYDHNLPHEKSTAVVLWDL
jgi:hypothetical protein